MEIKPLNIDERKILKDAINQTSLGFFLIAIISIILNASVVGYIHIKMNSFSENEKLFSSLFLVILSLLLFTGFLYKSVRVNLQELKDGLKNVITGELTDKKNKITYGWSGNPVVDAKYSSNSNYGTFEVEGFIIVVDSTDYNRFEIGDFIEICWAPKSKIILGIQKKDSSHSYSYQTAI